MSVFISHSQKDEGPYTSLSAALEGKGLKNWDPKSMKAGSSLKDQLRTAINDCEVCVFLATKNSVKSKWCLAEVGAFWGADVTVITFLSDSELTDNDLPPQFKGELWTRDVREVIRSVEDSISFFSKNKIDYGIKITHPEDGANVPNYIVISGTYQKRPPDELIRILEYNPSSHEYWPKQYLTFNKNVKTWSADIFIGSDSHKKRIVKVAEIGPNGKTLLRFADRIIGKNNFWLGIEVLTEDIVVCDYITLTINAEIDK